MRELPIPPAAREDRDSLEMIRVWIADERQHFSLAAEAWDDVSTWGMMLADLARGLSDAYEKRGLSDKKTSLGLIRNALDAELDRPTDTPVGDFMDE